MAGTLFGLPLSQQFDTNGDPLVGALLYLFAAGTSTPAISYSESGLITEQGNPLVADASGRIPQFWLDDGTYRARLTTALGVEVFDEDGILALGPSTAGGGSGGGGSSVDATSIATTGDIKWRPVAGALTGWVRANGRTMGSAASGGTERANADTQTLYEFLWNNFSDIVCPVVLGRGASALSDFNAHKAITTLDMRGRTVYGVDDMGNTAAGVLTGHTGEGNWVGSQEDNQTLSVAHLPAHTHGPGSLSGFTTTGGSHTHGLNNANNVLHGPDNNDANSGTGTNQYTSQDITMDSDGSHSHGVTVDSGSSGSTGGGSQFLIDTISPGSLGTWYIKL